jgi:hypothetical protein
MPKNKTNDGGCRRERERRIKINVKKRGRENGGLMNWTYCTKAVLYLYIIIIV